MIAQASGHRWRDSQRLVNPREIVVHEVNRHYRRVIFHPLAERIG